MLGNGPCDDGSITDTSLYAYEGAGDCAWAGPGHETMAVEHNVKSPVAPFTAANILDQYAQYLGLPDYQALNSDNDRGSDVQEVLKIRSTTGLLDTNGKAHFISEPFSLEVGNFEELWEGLYFFDCVGIGINFPESAMNQFNNNQCWSVVPGAQIEGGHYIPLVGRPAQNIWTCVTWGKRQTMTKNFIKQYMDEAYVYLTEERYSSVTGETPQGYKDIDLEKFIALVGKPVS